jgi:hypothetical protein
MTRPAFERHRKHASGMYHGASLRALDRLGRRLGYRLVGTGSSGINAFFLRDDLATDRFPAVPVDAAYRSHKYRVDGGLATEAQRAKIADMPVVEIGPAGTPAGNGLAG